MSALASKAVLQRVAGLATDIVAAVANRQNNDLSPTAVADAKPVLKEEIQKAIATAPAFNNTAVVEVKSPVESKTIWTQIIGVAAGAIVYFATPYLTDWGAPAQLTAMFTVATVTQILTVIVKAVFSDSVLSTALPKA